MDSMCLCSFYKYSFRLRSCPIVALQWFHDFFAFCNGLCGVLSNTYVDGRGDVPYSAVHSQITVQEASSLREESPFFRCYHHAT